MLMVKTNAGTTRLAATTGRRAKLAAAGRKRVADFDADKIAQRTREVLGL